MSSPRDREFERAMVEAMPKVNRVARHLTRTAWGADDLTQQTLMKAWVSRESFAIGSNMGAWLCFICRNEFFSDKRRSWRVVEMAEGQAEAVPCQPTALDLVQLKEALVAVSYLEPTQAEAIMMAAEGMTYEEMAAELGVAEGTVKSRVSRARAALDIYFAA